MDVRPARTGPFPKRGPPSGRGGGVPSGRTSRRASGRSSSSRDSNGFLAWAVVGLYLALVPALLERALNSDDPALAGGVLAAVLVWSLPAQIVGARRAPRTTQLLGVGGLTASLLLLAATEAASLHATLASALLAGVGHGLAFSGAVRAVDARIAGHHAGTGAALYLLFYLGSGTPAIAVGLIATSPGCRSPRRWPRSSWAGVTLGALALLATLPRPQRKVAENAGAMDAAGQSWRRESLGAEPGW